jgi:hypothetical protein
VYNQDGTYAYPSLTAFAQDFSSNRTNAKDYTLFTQQFGNPVRSLGTRSVGSIRDRTTGRPRAGCRSRSASAGTKSNCRSPPNSNADFYETQSITSPNMTLQPRGGLSYLWNDRTVIRAGFGIYCTPFPMQMVDALFLGNGVYQTSITVNPNQSGAPLFSKVISEAPPPSPTPPATSPSRTPSFAIENRAERHVRHRAQPRPGHHRHRQLRLRAAACICGR